MIVVTKKEDVVEALDDMTCASNGCGRQVYANEKYCPQCREGEA